MEGKRPMEMALYQQRKAVQALKVFKSEFLGKVQETNHQSIELPMLNQSLLRVKDGGLFSREV